MSNEARKAGWIVDQLRSYGFDFERAFAVGSGAFWDEPDYTTVSGMLDDVSLGQDVHVYFRNHAGRAGWVLLIPSNGRDMVSDYSIGNPAFAVAVEAVTS